MNRDSGKPANSSLGPAYEAYPQVHLIISNPFLNL